jgi:hypothetical protein
LWSEPGVDAGASKEEQFPDAGFPGAVDEVVLNLEILVKELGRLGVVRLNAANFCGRHEYHLGAFRFVKGGDRTCVQQVQLGMGPPDQLRESLSLQFSPDGAADKSAMAGDVDARFPMCFHLLILNTRLPRHKVRNFPGTPVFYRTGLWVSLN